MRRRGKQPLFHLGFVSRNGGAHSFTELGILVRMLGYESLEEPEDIVHDLHLPIAPWPGTDTNSWDPQALADQGREFCGHEFEHYSIGACLFDGFGIVQETGCSSFRSALDAPPTDLIDALRRQADMGHHW